MPLLHLARLLEKGSTCVRSEAVGSSPALNSFARSSSNRSTSIGQRGRFTRTIWSVSEEHERTATPQVHDSPTGILITGPSGSGYPTGEGGRRDHAAGITSASTRFPSSIWARCVSSLSCSCIQKPGSIEKYPESRRSCSGVQRRLPVFTSEMNPKTPPPAASRRPSSPAARPARTATAGTPRAASRSPTEPDPPAARSMR